MGEEDRSILFQTSWDGCWIMDAEGRCRAANRAFVDLLGYSEEELVRMGAGDFEAGEGLDQTVQSITDLIREGLAQFQTRFRKKNGEWIDVEINAQPTEDGATLVVCRPVAPWRKPEARDEPEEEIYRLFFENATDEILFFSPLGICLDVNQRVTDLFGIERQEVIGKLFTHFLKYTEFSLRMILNLFRSVISGSGPLRNMEFKGKHKDGRTVWVEANINPIRKEGQLKGILVNVRDITDRKRTEEAVRQSEGRLRHQKDLNRLLLDASPAYIVAIAFDGRTMMMNRALLDALEYTEEEVVGVDYVSTFVAEEDRAALSEMFRSKLMLNVQTLNRNRIVSRSGRVRLVEWHGRTAVSDVDGRQFIVGIGIDITGRTEAETALREREETFRALAENTVDTIMRFDSEGRHLYVNPVVEAQTGIPAGDFIGKTHSELGFPPDLCTLWEEAIQSTFTRQTPGRSEFQLPNGTWIDWLLMPEFDPEGRVKAVLTSARDITEPKAAQNALEESERKFRSIVESSPMGMHLYHLEPDGRLVFVGANPAADRILRFDHAQLNGKTIEEAFPGLIETEIPERYRDLARNGGLWSNSQFIYEDDQVAGAFDVYAFQTAPNWMTAMFLDVSERMKADERLRESEAKFRGIAENFFDVLFITDRLGTITYLSPSTRSMFGWAPEKMIGRPFTDFLPDDQIALAMTEFQRTVSSGERSVNLVLNIKRGDGSTFPGELNGSLFTDGGRIIGTLGLIRDITERLRAEAALRESDEKYRTIVDATSEWIWEMDADGRHTFSNRVVMDILGYRPEELIGQPIYHLMHPEDFEQIKKILPEWIEKKKGWRGREIRLRHKDGSYRHVESSSIPILNEAGDLIGYRGVDRDITQRKQAEEELRASEGRYRVLSDMATEGIVVHDHGLILNTNRAFGEIIGHPSENLAGLQVLDIIRMPEPSRQVMKEHVDLYLPTPYEVIVEKEDGSRADVRVQGRLVEYMGKRVRMASLHDITSAKRSQRILEESEERFRLLIQNSLDIVTLLDGQGLQLAIYGPLEKILGYRKEELIGTSGFDHLHPDDLDSVLKAFTDGIREEGSIRTMEYRYRHKDGTWTTLEAIGSNLLHDPAVKAIVLNIRDVSERRRVEAENKKLEAQLLQAMKMEAVGRLAGGVAHDFNNLLTTIKGNAQLALMDLKPSDPLYETLAGINKASDSAANLTRQLLAFSRKQIIEPKILDLNDLITDMQKMLGRIIGEDIELKTALKPELGAVKVDPGQFEQILVNLVVNARDAMPEGGKLVIETNNVDLDEEYGHVHPNSTPGAYVLMAVSDTGTGIGEEVKRHLFEPFFTTKPKGKGTGLGLATIYGAVKQINGSVEVYSELGEGTTFKVYFPRVGGKAERLSKEGRGSAMPGGTETILLVEDELLVRDLATRILKKLGYKILSAPDGGQAFMLAEEFKERIDLLMTDVVMPGMNGRQLAQRLVKIHPEMNVLFTSGYTENVIAHHGVVDEDIHFIGKPYSPQALARKLRDVLDGRKESR